MQHLATTPSAINWSGAEIDWLSRLQQLVAIAEHGAADGEDLASLLSTCAAATKDMFVDAHNAGYYINSYTTKVNPGMDNVMRKIMEGIRNLHNTWNDEAAEKEKSGVDDQATSKRQESFRHLFGCMAICRETRYGMAGRLITLQTHPYECPTKYAALIAMRCNIDVQDLRRVPPPKL